MELVKIEVANKDLHDSIIRSLVDTRTVTKRSWKIVLALAFVMLAMNAGAIAWFYIENRHPHIRYIKSLGGKTLIGLTDADSIEANPDRENGGSIIEVVHRGKK